jgi:hypothetical protein
MLSRPSDAAPSSVPSASIPFGTAGGGILLSAEAFVRLPHSALASTSTLDRLVNGGTMAITQVSSEQGLLLACDVHQCSAVVPSLLLVLAHIAGSIGQQAPLSSLAAMPLYIGRPLDLSAQGAGASHLMCAASATSWTGALGREGGGAACPLSQLTPW